MSAARGMIAAPRIDEPASPLASNPEAAKLSGYPAFDWLRFVLASVVVLDHGGFRFLPFMTGSLAVKVFFALSGWLIGGILLRTTRAELPRFFFNRTTRIWIPYALAIVLLYGVAVAKEGIDVFWFKYLLLDVTFTHQLYTVFPAAHAELPLGGSGHQFWSIAVEEQFYLLAPLVMLWLPGGRSLRVWLPIALVALLLGSHAASISLGVLLAVLHRDHGIGDRAGVRRMAAIVAVGCAALLWRFGTNPVVAPIFAAATVLALALPGGRQPIALLLGGLSYPLYLNHWTAAFVVHFAQRHGLGKAAWLPAFYLCAVLIALGLYWAVDRPVQQRRNGWYSAALGRRMGVVAYTLVACGIVLGGAMHRWGPHASVAAGAG